MSTRQPPPFSSDIPIIPASPSPPPSSSPSTPNSHAHTHTPSASSPPSPITEPNKSGDLLRKPSGGISEGRMEIDEEEGEDEEERGDDDENTPGIVDRYRDSENFSSSSKTSKPNHSPPRRLTPSQSPSQKIRDIVGNNPLVPPSQSQFQSLSRTGSLGSSNSNYDNRNLNVRKSRGSIRTDELGVATSVGGWSSNTSSPRMVGGQLRVVREEGRGDSRGFEGEFGPGSNRSERENQEVMRKGHNRAVSDLNDLVNQQHQREGNGNGNRYEEGKIEEEEEEETRVIENAARQAHNQQEGSRGSKRMSTDSRTTMNYQEAVSVSRRSSIQPINPNSAPSNGNGVTKGSSDRLRDKERERVKSSDPPSSNPNPTSVSRHSTSAATTSNRMLGEYAIGKTLGAGSMGKVKLGLGPNGEKVAIKVVPRYTSSAAAQAQIKAWNEWVKDPEGWIEREREEKAKERLRKEGKERDKEKDKENGGGSKDLNSITDITPPTQPTKSFIQKAQTKDLSKEVRTIREASILLLLHHPYICGMKSMLVYPGHYYMICEYINGGQLLDYIISHGRLKERSARKFGRQIGSALEYCHANSVAHRAPELLSAKDYTGPEVDVWSFGVVLYVLVCGRVPFDDQSMPALHAKIKRGQAEYPAWLSTDCKNLLQRMLNTNPIERATLQEVLNHPWMTKGFDGPPNSHIPLREPLRASDLDSEVIEGMTGFEFGTPEYIRHKLEEILSSDIYAQATQLWYYKRGMLESGFASFIPGMSDDSLTSSGKSSDPHLINQMKNFEAGTERSKSPVSRRFSGLDFYRKKLTGGVVSAFSKDGDGKDGDMGGFGNNSRNGSGLLPTNRPDNMDPTRGFHPLISIYYLVKEKLERERVYGMGVFASSTISLDGPPALPAPMPAYSIPTTPNPDFHNQNYNAFETPVNNHRRQHSIQVPQTAPPAVKGSGKRSSLIMPPPSTSVPTSPIDTRVVDRQYNGTTSPRPSTAMNRQSVNFDSRPTTAVNDVGSMDHEVPLSPASLAKRFGSILSRAASLKDDPEGGSAIPGARRHRYRSSIGSNAHKSINQGPASALPEQADEPIMTRSNRPSGHQRGASVGGIITPPIRPFSVPNERKRHISVGAGAVKPNAPESLLDGYITEEDTRQQQMESATEENHRAQLPPSTVVTAKDVGFVGNAPSSNHVSSKDIKPVFLKGLFSVATTSTKSADTIRRDLEKVLERIGIKFREIKAGLECVYVPSIDLNSIPPSSKFSARYGTIGHGNAPSSKRKSSKVVMERSPSRRMKLDDREALSSPTNEIPTSNSFTDIQSPDVVQNSHQLNTVPAPPTAQLQAIPAPHGYNPIGDHEISTQEGTIVESDLIVRFEIFIVKVGWVAGLRGVQFRRIAGNSAQYAMLARRILHELKL